MSRFTSLTLWTSLFLQNCLLANAEDLAALARQIIQSNRDYEASVVSLNVAYTSQPLLADHRLDPDRPLLNWTWAKSGRREVVFSDPTFTGYGLMQGRIWSAFDGANGMDVIFRSFDSQQAGRMQSVPGDTSHVTMLTCFALALGWRVPHCESLVALMEQASPSELLHEPAKFRVGPGKFLERPAVKWTLKRFRVEERFPEHTVMAWFDPENDWLPCLIAVMPTMTLTTKPPPSQLPEGSMPYTIAVERFLEIDDPILGHSRRFPKVVRMFGGFPSVMTATSVQVNVTPPESLFEPPVSPGTEIVRNAGSRSEQRDFVGQNGEELHRLANEKETEFLSGKKPPLSSPAARKAAAGLGSVSAKPISRIWSLSTVMVCGSVVALILVAIKRLRG